MAQIGPYRIFVGALEDVKEVLEYTGLEVDYVGTCIDNPEQVRKRIKNL